MRPWIMGRIVNEWEGTVVRSNAWNGILRAEESILDRRLGALGVTCSIMACQRSKVCCCEVFYAYIIHIRVASFS